VIKARRVDRGRFCDVQQFYPSNISIHFNDKQYKRKFQNHRNWIKHFYNFVIPVTVEEESSANKYLRNFSSFFPMAFGVRLNNFHNVNLRVKLQFPVHDALASTVPSNKRQKRDCALLNFHS